MKLIYTLILLLFSSSVFAEFLYVKSSISDLLDYGFHIEQIDTIGKTTNEYDMHTYVYHLRGDYGRSGGTTEFTDVAICYYTAGETLCSIDTQDNKSLIFDLMVLKDSKPTD